MRHFFKKVQLRSGLWILLLSTAFSAMGQQSAELKALLAEADSLKDTKLDQAIEVIESKVTDFSNTEQPLVYKSLGDLYRRGGRLPEADSVYQLALPGLKESNEVLALLQLWQSHIGISFQQGKIDQGIALSAEAMAFIETNANRLNDSEAQLSVGDILKNTGILYAIQADSKPEQTDREADVATAKSYFRKALTRYQQYEDKQREATALFNLGAVSIEIDSTIYYYAQSGEIYDELNLPYRKADISLNLGFLYTQLEEFDKALDYLQDADAKMRRPDPYNETLLYVKLGRVHLRLGNLQEATGFIDQALPMARQYELSHLEIEAYEILLPALYGQDKFKEALDRYVEYDTLSKRARFNEAEQISRDIEAQYKTKEQADAIRLNEARISRQRLLIILFLCIALAIGVVSYYLWKRGRERKEMNARLQKLDQARTRFLVNIPHELRTPLTLVHAPLQDAVEQLNNERLDLVEKDLQKIRSNTDKLLQLTEEVLDISKLDEEGIVLKPEATDLAHFLPLSFYAFESLAMRKGLKWLSDINVANDAYLLDQRKMEKVINNLLSNAIKNTPRGGTVHFKANIEAHRLSFSVADTGKGIPAEKLDQVFQRYFQVEKSDQISGGLGIGLSYVKELLDVMKGQISVESALGEGTTFSVTLPLEATSEAPAHRGIESVEPLLENRPALDLSSKEKPHLLVVEDNPEMSDFIRQLLSESYRITLAENGKEAIKRLQSDKFDLITADVMMPEMDGLTFVSKLKQHSDWKYLPVVMITALSAEADKIEGLSLGIDDYVTKPFNAKELQVRAANLLQNAQVRKSTLSEQAPETPGNEQQILTKARQTVEEHLADNDFGVKDLADRLNLSERQANRVLKKLTGLSCLQFIRELKLQKAYRLLEARHFATIAEVANAVGFENTSYFTRLFAERFGKKPSEFS